MEYSAEITKLCEAWWEKLSDSTRGDQVQYAAQFLQILGWQESTPIDTKANESPLSSTSFVLRCGGESSVAAHFMMPGSLEPPSSLVERGLDFCDSTRLLVNGTRRLNIPYAFITDLFRSYLYDTRTDELLLHGDSPDVFNRDIASVLTKSHIERGSLEEIRRQPRSYSARQLREWTRHWCELIASEAELSKETAYLAIDRLLILRFLFDHNILKRSDWRLQKRFSDLVATAFNAEGRGCGKELTTLFHDIWFDWKAELYSPLPQLDEALERDEITAPLLKEFTLLSKSKFTIATILESFNYGDPMEKARVRLVPEPDEERLRYLSKQTLDSVDDARIHVDIIDEGYRSIFFWFDKMVALYDRLGVEFDSETYHNNSVPRDMDLFTWSELDANRPGALSDKYQHVLERGLAVYYGTSRQYRTARLLLYLHLISSYDESKQRFVQFPAIESALQERPKNLDTQRNWKTNDAASGYDDWDAV